MDHADDDVGEEGEAASSVSEEVEPPKTDLAAATELITAVVSSASTSFINPTFFSGLPTEDPRDWLTYLQDWVKYKNLNESAQARLLPLLFKGAARSWFIQLDDDQKDTFDHLKEAFEKRYFPTDLSKWQTMSDMWSRKQSKKESVDDYVTAVLKMARVANMDDKDTQRYAIIKGLLPDIRRHVLQQNPDSLAAVIAAAKVAEQSMRTDETPEFIMAVNRLENKIDAISLMNDPNNQPTSSLQRTNNDYTTSGARQPPRSTNTSSYQYERNRTPPPDPRTSGYDQQAYQPRTSNFRRDERFRDSTYDEQFRGGGQRAPPRGIMRQPTNYVNNQRRTVSFNTSDFQPCDRCGQTGHNAGTCRFKNAFCFYCAKQGHIKRACRSARLRNPPS